MAVTARQLRWAASAGVAALALLVSGCSGVPLAPDRWFEPSPTPARPPAQPPAQTTAPPPTATPRPVAAGPADVDLAGTLTTRDGGTADVRSRLWFGPPTTSAAPDHGGEPGWVAVGVDLTGLVTVTNTGPAPDPAGRAVLFEHHAGHPVASRVCRLLAQGPDPAAVAGGYCWQQVGSATLFDQALGRAAPLPPDLPQTVAFWAGAGAGGLRVGVPTQDADAVGRALRRPAVVVVTTSDARPGGTTVRFRSACQVTGELQPSAPGGPAEPVAAEQHVILGASVPLTCAQLPPLTS